MSLPEKIGQYEIKEQIGRGSTGIVYKGYDPFTDHYVAVKLAISNAVHDDKLGERCRKMFFNEAHTAGILEHPNIIKILDSDSDEDHCYIVMELVEGADTLKPYCSSSNLLPFELVVEIIFKCAEALDYVHRNSIVHRDIKPTNILFTQDKDVKIVDFSIAHLMTSDPIDTLQMGFAGSPRYMSPEQIQDDVISSQGDLFSLGIVMYELLTGEHPFAADSFSHLIHNIINENHLPLSTHRSDLPEVLEKIIYHALQKEPTKRYKIGLNFAADLRLVLD